VTLKSVFACKPALAMAAVIAAGSLPSATDAAAAYGHRRGGHWGGYHYSGGYHHGGYSRGGGYYRPYAHHDYYRGFRTYPRYRYSGYSCDRWRWVATPWGWRQRHVNTCYQYYRSYYNFY
jgi:hypothetical protein